MNQMNELQNDDLLYHKRDTMYIWFNAGKSQNLIELECVFKLKWDNI